MEMLKLNENLKVVKDYYNELENYARLGIEKETSVREAFKKLLEYCCQKTNLQLVAEYTLENPFRHTKIIIDGAFFDHFKIPHGYWEAKDTHDNLYNEIKFKFEKGYPSDNILFQSPLHAIIFQNKIKVFDDDIEQPKYLVYALEQLFNYKSEPILDWEQAVEQFKEEIPQLARSLLDLIEKEQKSNEKFITAFRKFELIVRNSINPNISTAAIEEMLIQHLLTQRIFEQIFNNPDFVNKNIIAHEIEQVILALTEKYFSKSDFLKPLNHFFFSIEKVASNIDDFSAKQTFLNTVYEKFFQGFAVKQADTLGIVYTPQPVVNFMVNSVEEILRREFNRLLASPNVHILDPFVGTGNFIINIMRKIPKTSLEHKYSNELHCNEVMLLPYYVATMNIEHTFYERMGYYKPFPGACLVDTFELAETKQLAFTFTEENTQRIQKLKETPIFVYISNPPYNAGQVNENDNNKNRKYPAIDQRISHTFAKDSKSTNKATLYDPYVRAFRYTMDKIIEQGEGVIAFITNNSFLDAIAFDGMRKHIYENFDKIYHINLRGNARTSGERRKKEKGNIFEDKIRVSVGITFLVKFKTSKREKKIYYYDIGDYLTAEEKKKIIENFGNIYNVPWREIVPDRNHTWLTEGLQEDFDTFLPMGTKEAKAGKENAIFKIYSRGVFTSRDAWVYNWNFSELRRNVEKTIDVYNYHVFKYQSLRDKPNIDDFVDYDDKKISWDSHLKYCLRYQKIAEFELKKIRTSLYRPFCKQFLFYDQIFNNTYTLFYKIFPTAESEKENRAICLTGLGWKSPFFPLMCKYIVDVQVAGNTQCFPFYIYDEDGSNRRENITDWALEQFRSHYNDPNITKWDIFHYIYAVLHKSEYRQKYAQNLRRSLPRIPFYEDFWKYAQIGRQLADLHVNYEQAEEYPLEKIENPNLPLDYRVEKMYLSADRRSIKYNDFLTLSGIPAEAFEYRLGNRSALEWIIDQYRMKVDPRSGIVNDPNNPADPEYIIRLLGKIIAVSLETIEILNKI